MINVRASLNLLCYVCMSLKVVLFLNFTPENNFWSIVERRTEASPLSNWNISFWTQAKSKRDKRRRMKKRQETSWNANNVVRWVSKVLMYFIHFGCCTLYMPKKMPTKKKHAFYAPPRSIPSKEILSVRLKNSIFFIRRLTTATVRPSMNLHLSNVWCVCFLANHRCTHFVYVE